MPVLHCRRFRDSCRRLLNPTHVSCRCHAQDVTDPRFVLRNIDLSLSSDGQTTEITEGYLRRKEAQVLPRSSTRLQLTSLASTKAASLSSRMLKFVPRGTFALAWTIT